MNTYTTPPSAAINPADLLGILSKHRGLIILGTVLTTALFTAAAFVIPKRYKSTFTLSIYSNYFQNPLTKDFTSEVMDTTEMRAQREALIRQALSPVFVDTLGAKYGIYGTHEKSALRRVLERLGISRPSNEEQARSQERKDLQSRIEVTNLNSNTYIVGFQYSNADVTYHAVQDIYTQITDGLVNIRRNNLVAVHNAIEKRLEALAQSLPTLDPASGAAPAVPPAAMTREVPNSMSISEELADVRSQLRVLTARYTEEHPLVKELRERERDLSALASTPDKTPPGALAEKPLAVRVPQAAAEEIYKELTKKLNYLNVSLDSDPLHAANYFATLDSPSYPTAPLWPKKALFVLWGFGVGFLGSFFIAALREYFDRTALHAPILSQQLGLPLLGELPVVYWGTAFPNSRRPGTSLERAASRN